MAMPPSTSTPAARHARRPRGSAPEPSAPRVSVADAGDALGGVDAVAFGNIASKRPDEGDLVAASSTVGIPPISPCRYLGGAAPRRWLAVLGADVSVVPAPAARRCRC
ncbi:MAG: hypothetical protein ACLFU0_09225 [Alphaproteobacteria bacterium]